jgi:5,10-methenyltetrahydromethanopterin hydrogenase
MIKHYIDYTKAFLRNWKEIKENIHLIITKDLIHRKVVLQTDDLNKTFNRMKYIIDYKPTYKRKPDDLKKILADYPGYYDLKKANETPSQDELNKIFNLSKQTPKEFLSPEIK